MTERGSHCGLPDSAAHFSCECEVAKAAHEYLDRCWSFWRVPEALPDDRQAHFALKMPQWNLAHVLLLWSLWRIRSAASIADSAANAAECESRHLTPPATNVETILELWKATLRRQLSLICADRRSNRGRNMIDAELWSLDGEWLTEESDDHFKVVVKFP